MSALFLYFFIWKWIEVAHDAFEYPLDPDVEDKSTMVLDVEEDI